jgi:hypothetical protein
MGEMARKQALQGLTGTTDDAACELIVGVAAGRIDAVEDMALVPRTAAPAPPLSGQGA